jgi:hypothetical protein
MQFISPCSLDQWIHCIPTRSCSLRLVKSLDTHTRTLFFFFFLDCTQQTWRVREMCPPIFKGIAMSKNYAWKAWTSVHKSMEFVDWNCRGDHKVQTHTHRAQYLLACLLSFGLLTTDELQLNLLPFFCSLAAADSWHHCFSWKLKETASIGTSPNKLVFCKNHTLWNFPPPPPPPLLFPSEVFCVTLSFLPPKSPLCDPAPPIHSKIRYDSVLVHPQQSIQRWKPTLVT